MKRSFRKTRLTSRLWLFRAWWLTCTIILTLRVAASLAYTAGDASPAAHLTELRNSGYVDQPSRGVVYFGYHNNPEQTLRYVAAIARVIVALKRHNPMLKVAVITNAELSTAQQREYMVDEIVRIPQADVFPGRQWWTRLLHLNSSPYEETLALDSDRTVCSDISSVFALLHDYDMLGVSAGILPALDNGVMAYRKGPKFDELLKNWKHYQLQLGQFGNDQPSLSRAIDSTAGFACGVLPPAWQVKYIPAQGQKWGNATAPMRTLVIHGEAKIAAGAQCPSILTAGDGRARMLVHIAHSLPAWRAVHSQVECEELLNGTCAHAEIDWESTYLAMPRAEYLGKHGF